MAEQRAIRLREQQLELDRKAFRLRRQEIELAVSVSLIAILTALTIYAVLAGHEWFPFLTGGSGLVTATVAILRWRSNDDDDKPGD